MKKTNDALRFLFRFFCFAVICFVSTLFVLFRRYLFCFDFIFFVLTTYIFFLRFYIFLFAALHYFVYMFTFLFFRVYMFVFRCGVFEFARVFERIYAYNNKQDRQCLSKVTVMKKWEKERIWCCQISRMLYWNVRKIIVYIHTCFCACRYVFVFIFYS